MTLFKTVFNSLCLLLIHSFPGSCSNDFFHTALIITLIHFPGCTILLNKKLWVIIPIMLKVQRRKGQIFSFWFKESQWILQVRGLNKIRNLEYFNLHYSNGRSWSVVLFLLCYSACSIFSSKTGVVVMWCVIHFRIFINSNVSNGTKCLSLRWLETVCMLLPPNIYMVAVILFPPLPLPSP